jgi:hypothetical protein
MAEIPNLAGVVTKDLVDTIGSGNFKASYVNWSRTLNLLRQNAPGWMPETVPSADGSLLHRAPVGGYLMIRFAHVDGTETPCVPQSIMDTRNNAIAYEKITARDITDTQRRGTCLAAAFFFGLAYELWAKMPVESGYEESVAVAASSSEAPRSPSKAPVTKSAPVATLSEADFTAAASSKGLCAEATQKLLGMIKGDYAKGIKTLESKDEKWVKEQNAPFSKAGNAEAW